MRMDGRLRSVPVEYDPAWIREGVLPFDAYAVGSLVPVLFESYGRILHPAWAFGGAAVRWDTVAAWSGRTAHALAQFDPLSRPLGETVGPSPFERRPDEGALPPRALSALREVLAAHTTMREACFVGVWEGGGWFEPRRFRTLRLQLPGRVHLVFAGPLEAVDDVGRTSFDGSFLREAPSIIWPTDRAWFVSTDVDQDSTFIGGSRALLEALVVDDRLEVWSVAPTDPITWDSDTINTA
jgi:hypothetical protein